MPDPKDALPPGQADQDAAAISAAAAAAAASPATKTEERPTIPTDEERQSTKEWLRSLGIVAGEVATREQPRVEREAERREAVRPERVERGRDTDEVLNLLREGDDERFIEGIVDLSRKRVLGEMTRTERDAAFGNEVNKFVKANAPDVPLVVFWSFAERAERMFPMEVDKQIDWAIGAGRAAMESHNAENGERVQLIRQTQEQSDTLNGTPTRQRRRGARESQERPSTFVEELLAARSKYDG